MRNGWAVVALLGVAAACSGKTTVSGPPTTCTGFGSVTRQARVDKIDVLFVIDDSPSMADKRAYVMEAVPDLVVRLLQPQCVGDDGRPIEAIADANGACSVGHPAYPPIHDMHLGIVTGSLGARGGDACTAAGGDDRAHLVNRGGDAQTPVADASPSGFLAWYPDVPENAPPRSPGANVTPLKDRVAFESDFFDQVAGVRANGCGLESPLESFYRFLVQPDPYASIDASSGTAKWVGIDPTIVQQRHDFLRPDSVVVVIDVSDESDSEIDVRALGGQGYLFLRSDFQPPRGTGACLTNPGDPGCTSCRVDGSDPNCAKGNYTAQNDWGFDMNLRHVQMKRKYGVDVQFPIERYLRGLTQAAVPNREGEYPPGATNYVGNANCTNPLFATDLPDGAVSDPKALCELRRGPRTKDLVFYVHVGGVPNALLHVGSALSDDDWRRILGNDPEHYDYAGIDPRMIEDYKPRAGADGDFVTDSNGSVDLEYACTFPLAAPIVAPPSSAIDPSPCATGASPACDPTATSTQTRARAYPTTRQLLLAKRMGAQGAVASICPAHVLEQAPGDPLFGYRPALETVIDRLTSALEAQCLPDAFPVASDGTVSCVLLEALPDPAMTCDARSGLVAADPQLAQQFRNELGDASSLPICAIQQLSSADFVDGSCAKSQKPGWCYVAGASAAPCVQTIVFSSPATILDGARVSIQCSKGC